MTMKGRLSDQMHVFYKGYNYFLRTYKVKNS